MAGWLILQDPAVGYSLTHPERQCAPPQQSAPGTAMMCVFSGALFRGMSIGGIPITVTRIALHLLYNSWAGHIQVPVEESSSMTWGSFPHLPGRYSEC